MGFAALFKANFIAHTALLRKAELLSYSEQLVDDSIWKIVNTLGQESRKLSRNVTPRICTVYLSERTTFRKNYYSLLYFMFHLGSPYI